MLPTRNLQPSLWESVLPEVCLRLPAELERVDRWLDDEVLFAPFRAYFDPLIGRPCVPMETYLRMMFLKYRYRLGFETLCREVSDSISWRLFCHIDLDARVPHPTTLMKITIRCGESTVLALNEALLGKAVEAKVVKTGKVRADTTVVSASVEYPTDSGLLAHAMVKIGKLVRRIKAAGGAVRTGFRDRSRSAVTKVRSLAAKLRLRGAQAKDEAQATVLRITGELADLAQRSSLDACPVLDNARRALRRVAGRARGRPRRAINELATTVERAGRVIAQTRRRIAGDTPTSATRIVSLHDPDARPIVNGRLGKPVEFGYKAQVVDNEDGIVLDHTVEEGNPSDAPQLTPAIARIKQRTGTAPGKVTADRGYGEAKVDQDLHDLGVKTVAIPRKGQPGAARRATEHSRSFQDLIKWRTGAEGRISHLKHRYSWARSGMDGRERTAIWCGHGILAHNLVKITRLAAAETA
jgi:IS5 family transposase